MSSRQMVEVRDRARRLLANRRERQRVNNINDMYLRLLRLLPLTGRKPGKLSRLQILREATAYIQRLGLYLSLPQTESIDAEVLFPHAFHRQYDNQLETYQRTLAPADNVITTSTPI